MQRSLWDVVPRNHRDTQEALRRRQAVTVGVVLLGAVVLGVLLLRGSGVRSEHVDERLDKPPVRESTG